jgi:hypothetical protein
MYVNETEKTNGTGYDSSLNTDQQHDLISLNNFAKQRMITHTHQDTLQKKSAYVLSFDNPAHARTRMS